MMGVCPFKPTLSWSRLNTMSKSRVLVPFGTCTVKSISLKVCFKLSFFFFFKKKMQDVYTKINSTCKVQSW